MQSFGQIMFTDAVRAEQEARGSRETCAHLALHDGPEALGRDEIDFIQSRDSLYMATVSQTGWPYVQHRGGPAGFLRVLGSKTLGFADYRGNRQYISTGHLAGEARISLFLMDYARKARLKILGRAGIVDADDDPALAARLAVPRGPAPERLVTIEVAAFDWNCPKYITPRVTEAEMARALTPRLAGYTQRISELEARLDALDPNWRKT